MEIENTPHNHLNGGNDIHSEVVQPKMGKIEGMIQEEEVSALYNQSRSSIFNPSEIRDIKLEGLSIGNLMALKKNSEVEIEENDGNEGKIQFGNKDVFTPEKRKKKRGRPRLDKKKVFLGVEMKDEIKILRKLSAAKNENVIDDDEKEQDCFQKLNGDLGFTPEFKIVRRKIRTRRKKPKSEKKQNREFLTPSLKRRKSKQSSVSRRRRRRHKSTKKGKYIGHSGYKKQRRGRNGRFVKGKKDDSDSSVLEFEEFYTSKEDEDRSRRGLRFKRYNDLVSSLKFLQYMNWENLDPLVYKTSPFHTPPLTIMSFWFLVCSQYFPRYDAAFYDYILTKTKKIVDKKNLKFDFMFKKPFKKKIKKDHFIESLKKSRNHELNEIVKNIDYDVIQENADKLVKDLEVDIKDLKDEEISNFKFQKNYDISQDIMLNKMMRKLEKDFSEKIEGDKSRLEKLLILKKLPLDCLINKLNENLITSGEKKIENFKKLQDNLKDKIKEEKYFEGTYTSDYALKDLYPRFKEEIKFLDLLEENQHNSITLNKTQKTNQVSSIGLKQNGTGHKKSDDYDCQICSDGDYSEDNLIVFCARCNISVHQKCYGLKEVPKGNWICDMCRTFGPEGKYLPCPFCPKRGGAMRKIWINSYDECWKNLNFEYYKEMQLKEGESGEDRIENMEYGDQSAIEDDDTLSINSKNFTEFLYYNFHKIPVFFSEEELKKCPKPKKTWVHLSCCHWIPEIYFKWHESGDEECISDEEKAESVMSGILQTREKKKKKPFEIKGIDEIDKRRYNLKCEICDKKQGAGVQCAQRKCQLSYHIECARRANIFIEPANTENPCYIIYCEKHAPLMIKRELEAKKKSTVQEITKFCRTVEKYYQSYKYKFDLVNPKDKSFFYLKEEKRRNKGYERQTNCDFIHPLYNDLVHDKFMREVDYELNKFPEFGNVIQLKKNLINDENGIIQREYKFMEYEPPKKRFLYNKVPKTHKVWSKMAKSRNWQVKGVYKKYRRLLAGSKEDPLFGLEKKRVKIKKLKYKFTSVPYREVRNGILFVENKEGNSPFKPILELSDELFCECRKPWKGEIMAECSVCRKWFHPECLGITEKDEVKLNQMIITCSGCRNDKQGFQVKIDDVFLGKRNSPCAKIEEEEFKIPESSPTKKLKFQEDEDKKQMIIEDKVSTQDPHNGSELTLVKQMEVSSLQSNQNENLVINVNRIGSQEELSLLRESSEIKQTKIKEFFASKPEKLNPNHTETKNSKIVSPDKSPTSTSV